MNIKIVYILFVFFFYKRIKIKVYYAVLCNHLHNETKRKNNQREWKVNTNKHKG